MARRRAIRSEETGERLVCRNRRAFFEYHIEERIEAGLVLVGGEVKSMREGQADLVDSYASVRDHELWLVGAHVAPHPHAAFPHDPRRPRKLLVHRAELRRLTGKLKERGFSLVPLRLYFKEGRVKVELGLGKGKRTHDRREEVKKREADREVREARRVRR